MRVTTPWTAALAAIVFTIVAGAVALADLASGTEIYATLQSAIDTKTAKTGDPVTLKVTSLYPDSALNTTVQGAVINAHVAKAVAASPTKKAYLLITFDTIALTDGRSYPFPGQIVSMQKQKRTNIAQAAGEILTGMVVGNTVGKAGGSDVGGAIGAMGGAVYAAQMSQNFRIAENSTIKLRTTDSIPITPTHPQQR